MVSEEGVFARILKFSRIKNGKIYTSFTAVIRRLADQCECLTANINLLVKVVRLRLMPDQNQQNAFCQSAPICQDNTRHWYWLKFCRMDKRKQKNRSV
jgi:hypothetical protein